MNEQSFNIVIRINKKYNRIFYLLMVLFIIWPIAPILFHLSALFSKIIFFTIFGSFLIWTLYLMVRSWVIKDYKSIGKIIFRSDSLMIAIDQKPVMIYFYNELKSLRVNIAGYNGQAVGYYGSASTSNGSYNELIFQNNDKKNIYKFLITNKYYEKWLKEYLSFVKSKYPYIVFYDSNNAYRYFGFGWIPELKLLLNKKRQINIKKMPAANKRS
jgi:hypothetical protein